MLKNSKGLDGSGCMNNVVGTFSSGPALGGVGYSGAFDGRQSVQIPNSHWFNSGVFSLTFWVFLPDEIYDGRITNFA